VLRLNRLDAHPRQYPQLLQPLAQQAHRKLVEPTEGDAGAEGVEDAAARVEDHLWG
jgi:hypothetical protein